MYGENIRGKQAAQTALKISSEDLERTFERTAQWANFSSAVQTIHAGPKVRGSERKQFSFTDGSSGDVYRAVLLAMKEDPRLLTFTYDQIFERVRIICKDGPPTGSSVNSALSQAAAIAETVSQSALIDWDEDILTIVDPYFLFYLRCSKRLTRLGDEEAL